MKTISLIILLAILLPLQACLNDGSGVSGPGALPPLKLEGQVIACESDDDCVMVELGCCPGWCIGGGEPGEGWAAAVNTLYEDDVKERNTETCDPDTFCADIYCGEVFPVCEDGTCVLHEEDWKTCESDDDCTIVELGCCDHCNGGRTVATNVDFADDIEALYGDECEEDQACTLMACAPILAKCLEGMCMAYEDESWGPEVE